MSVKCTSLKMVKKIIKRFIIVEKVPNIEKYLYLEL